MAKLEKTGMAISSLTAITCTITGKSVLPEPVVIVNTSHVYSNPDAFAKDLIRPKFKMDKVVADTVKIFGQIPLREVPEEPNDQPEALAVIVMNYDGVNPATLVDYFPDENEVRYERFIQRITRLYVERFSRPR